ncbi:hypothetical protein KAR91_80065 [Candidatus Pacearchaeota archaeon]|nr:hypothetical protein [Candidatus Pacearchaeota archaeon]
MKRSLIKTLEAMIKALDAPGESSFEALNFRQLLCGLKDRLVLLEAKLEDHPWDEAADRLTFDMPDHRDPTSPEWTREVAAIFVGRSYEKPKKEEKHD